MTSSRTYLYARAEDRTAIQEQINLLNEYAHEHSMVVYGEFTDQTSGRSRTDESFNKLLDVLRERQDPSILLVSPGGFPSVASESLARIKESSRGQCVVYTPMLCELEVDKNEVAASGIVQQHF